MRQLLRWIIQIDNQMSSNLTIPRQPYSTPQLKRSHQLNSTLNMTSRVIMQLPLHSRYHNQSSRQSQQSPPLHNNPLLQKQSKKDIYSTISSTLIDQQAQTAMGEVLQINEVFKSVIADDLKYAQRRKERKGYSHTYEQKTSHEQIWIGQPRQIPKQVFEVEAEARQEMLNRYSHQKINCLQGFIPELSLFYYSIQETLMFFDAQNINSQSAPLSLIKLQKRTLSALYNIQVFTLGRPYFQTKKQVMILLHPYEAEMYQFDLKRSIDQQNRKRLDIKPLNCCFPIPQERANKLYMSSKGYLYCSDDKGKVFKIDFNDQFWHINNKQLSTKKLAISAMTLVKNTTKFLTNSLQTFARSIKNYTLSFLASRPIETQILFDDEKQLIVVFVKQQNNRQNKGRKFIQYFLVYDYKTNELLYIHKDLQFVFNDDEIVLFKQLQHNSSSKYNFILLLKSGKRVLLDIHNDRIKKTTLIKQPPVNLSEGSNNNKYNEINSYFMQENIMGQIVTPNDCFLLLTKQSNKQNQCVTHVRLQAGEIANIYHQVNQPLGYRKKCFLQYQSPTSKTQNLAEMSRQIFYCPHELYFSTDQAIQRIKILRPIDIFYTLFIYFSENVPDFFRKIKKIMPELLPKDMVCLCSQLLLDSQGKYYISHQLHYSLDNRNYLPKAWSQGQLEQHCFKNIDRKTRTRLLETIVDIAVNNGMTERTQKQKFIVDGVLQYYGKLLKNVFLTNINIFSSQTCKVIGSTLQQLRKFLFQLQEHLKCDLKSYIGKALKWVNKFWQVVILAKDIPNLPNLTLDEALVEQASSFHPHLFHFLIKQCSEEVFDQVKKLMPSLITDSFTMAYRLYCEVFPLKDAQKILDICRCHQDLPDYFIDYLIKYKKIPQAILLKASRRQQASQINTQTLTFDDKMKEFYSQRIPLYEKQQILMQAEILLSEQCKREKIEKKQQNILVHNLRGQLKLQELIIQIYHTRVTNKSVWTNIISTCLNLPPVTQQEQAIIQKLKYCLMDRQFLEQVINKLDNTLLRVMHTYYFDPPRFESMFFALAEDIYNFHPDDIFALSQALQKQLYFMICRAKLLFSFDQLQLILETYICLICRIPSLNALMTADLGIKDRRLYWPLIFSAEIGIDVSKIYTWALGKMQALDRHDPHFLYMAICLSYLVKDFFTEKKSEFTDILRCQEATRAELKQVYFLVFS